MKKWHAVGTGLIWSFAWVGVGNAPPAQCDVGVPRVPHHGTPNSPQLAGSREHSREQPTT